jgi:hypothetical protein
LTSKTIGRFRRRRVPITRRRFYLETGVPMKLLVIEDDREAAEYLEKAFDEAGHRAHIAADGEPAMRWPVPATMTFSSSTACCRGATGSLSWRPCARAATTLRS